MECGGEEGEVRPRPPPRVVGGRLRRPKALNSLPSGVLPRGGLEHNFQRVLWFITEVRSVSTRSLPSGRIWHLPCAPSMFHKKRDVI